MLYAFVHNEAGKIRNIIIWSFLNERLMRAYKELL